MIIQLFDFITNFIIQVIKSTGYVGLFLLMAAESCGVPAPSTIVMPFSGFLVAMGKMNFWLVAITGTFANLSGSLLAYYISLKGGRPLLEKYGKYILIAKHDLDEADKWFAKYGEAAVFTSRLLPVIRTYISFPAGVAKMDVKKFLFYSFWGILPWNIAFTFIGIKLENNWEAVRGIVDKFGAIIIILVFLAAGLYIRRHIKKRKKMLI
jgi:membrane protein DedA with SNARE-associated domain